MSDEAAFLNERKILIKFLILTIQYPTTKSLSIRNNAFNNFSCMKIVYLVGFLLLTTLSLHAQTAQDTLAIRKAALAYIESQHTPNPKLMESALHPRLVKRSVFKNKATQKDYVSEYFTENMVLLAESYNAKGDKFPKNPKKEVKLLDVSPLTASVKLTADEWIDYMHVVKVNGEWKIINVLWQYHDVAEHR